MFLTQGSQIPSIGIRQFIHSNNNKKIYNLLKNDFKITKITIFRYVELHRSKNYISRNAHFLWNEPALQMEKENKNKETKYVVHFFLIFHKIITTFNQK